VFDAATAARGRLKTLAKDAVQRYYSKLLDVEGFEHGSQLEYQSIIKTQVENALEGGSFLEGGVDANVFLFLFGVYYELNSVPA
jgi:hypothetical protein